MLIPLKCFFPYLLILHFYGTKNRNITTDIVNRATSDSLYGILSVPGLFELLGPQNVYRSNASLSYTADSRFQKAVSGSLHYLFIFLFVKQPVNLSINRSINRQPGQRSGFIIRH